MYSVHSVFCVLLQKLRGKKQTSLQKMLHRNLQCLWNLDKSNMYWYLQCDRYMCMYLHVYVCSTYTVQHIQTYNNTVVHDLSACCVSQLYTKNIKKQPFTQKTTAKYCNKTLPLHPKYLRPVPHVVIGVSTAISAKVEVGEVEVPLSFSDSKTQSWSKPLSISEKLRINIELVLKNSE